METGVLQIESFELDATEVTDGAGENVKTYRVVMSSGRRNRNDRSYDFRSWKKLPDAVPLLYGHGGGGIFGGADLISQLPIGRTENIKVDNRGRLVGRVRFGTDDHSQLVHSKWEQRLIDTVSIGFRGLKIEERKDGEETYQHYTDGDLMELSVVAVPADPRAGRLDSAIISDAINDALKIDERIRQLATQTSEKLSELEGEINHLQNENDKLRAVIG